MAPGPARAARATVAVWLAAMVVVVGRPAAAETYTVSNAGGDKEHQENHLHREIMLNKANSAGTRPKISFKLHCDKNTDVRWLVINSSPKKIMPSKFCAATPTDPGRRRRAAAGDDDASEDDDGADYEPDGSEDDDASEDYDASTDAMDAYEEGATVAPTAVPGPTPSSAASNRLHTGCVKTPDGCCNPGSGMTVLPSVARSRVAPAPTMPGRAPVSASAVVAARQTILWGGTEKCEKGKQLWVQLLHKGYMQGDANRKVVNNTWKEDGEYSLYMEWQKGTHVTGATSFLNLHGYLSAEKYPLMLFYGSMAIIYLLTGLAWAVMMAINHQDLLTLQYWIGGVIIAGMIEMAFSWGDLNHLNHEANGGYRSHGLLIFSKLLTAFKNTVSRLLVLVVCMGYGVVKPRLGDVKKQIAAVGLASFTLFALYGIVHDQEQPNQDEDKTRAEIIIIIPLSVLDAAIFWWIFFSLHHTMKLLALRQNIVKLTLYRRFQFTLGCCVIATVAFTLWTLTADGGIEDDSSRSGDAWRNAWFTEWGFWQLLFYTILVTIMVLFRPTMNNSRYAYAALDTDLEADEEFTQDETTIPHFGSETMTKRTLTARGYERQSAPKKATDLEQELLWVEDNIPASVTSNDNNFLNFPMDSDEEVMNTRFEASKME